MSGSTVRILTCLADALMDNRIDAITPHFAYPLPFFVKGELVVFGSAATLREGLAIYRDQVLAIGARKIRPRVIAEGMPVRGYSSVWIEWDHLDGAGKCLRTNQVRYATYQRKTDLYPRIEMVDYTVTAFPGLYDVMPGLRTA